MEPRKVPYDDLGGGLNEGLPAGAIADNEFTKLVNFYPQGKKLIRRGGTRQLTQAPYHELLTGLFTFKPESMFGSRAQNADWTIVGGLSSLGRVLPGASTGSGTVFSGIPGQHLQQTVIETLPGPAILPDTAVWDMHQYKAVGYAMRRKAGLLRFDHTRYSEAGIEAPATAPTLAEGGAGVLTAAAYGGVVVFVNRSSGALSNPGPVGTVTIVADKEINWSNIPVSADAQVDGRWLFRTLPDAEGVYLFVGEITDNTTTTFTDNVPIAEMGDFASFDNVRWSGDLQFGDFWQERLWTTDGVDLLYSEQFLPESTTSDNVVRVFPDDGMPPTAIVAVDKNRLIVAKHNAIHYITPAGSGFALDTLSDKVGCVAHGSMKLADGILIWYAGDSFYRSAGGGRPEDIASIKLQDTLKVIDPAYYHTMVAAIYPKHGWYLISLRTSTGFTDLTASRNRTHPNNVILVYNYRTGAWCKFEFPEGAPSFIMDTFDPRGERILQALMYDYHLHRFDYGNDDFGTPITAVARTKAYGWGNGLLTSIRRVFVMVTNAAAEATFRLYKNQATTAAKERTENLQDPPYNVARDTAASMKGINMSTLGNPGAQWQAEIEYSGGPAIEVEALAFDVVPLARSVRVR